MPRYIDADKLVAHLEDEIKGCEIPLGSRANGKGIAYGTALGLKSAISFAQTLSTADVVPKSEVEKLSGNYEDLKLKYSDLAKDRDELLAWGSHIKSAERAEIEKAVAREIFEEIEKYLTPELTGHFTYRYIRNALTELKEKYIN